MTITISKVQGSRVESIILSSRVSSTRFCHTSVIVICCTAVCVAPLTLIATCKPCQTLRKSKFSNFCFCYYLIWLLFQSCQLMGIKIQKFIVCFNSFRFIVMAIGHPSLITRITHTKTIGEDAKVLWQEKVSYNYAKWASQSKADIGRCCRPVANIRHATHE